MRTFIQARSIAAKWINRYPQETLQAATDRYLNPKEQPRNCRVAQPEKVELYHFKGKHISQIASTIRIEGEAWRSALQRASVIHAQL